MRDVAWGFFYGRVNFDTVFGTSNLYGKVEMFAGSYNESYKSAGLDLTETFDTPRDHGDLQGDPGRLGQRRLRSVRRAGGDRQHVDGREAWRQIARRSTAIARLAERMVGPRQATRRCEATRTATRSTALSMTCRRTSRRCMPSLASRTISARSTCSPTCRART